MNTLSSRERELVALGAAIASHCVPCVEYHVPAARQAGLSDLQIEEAVRLAEKVSKVPANAVVEAALARVVESPQPDAGAARSDCGCRGESDR